MHPLVTGNVLPVTYCFSLQVPIIRFYGCRFRFPKRQKERGMTYKHTYLSFLAILCSVVTVSAQVPFIRGGGERRVIEHVGHEKTLDGQMRAAQREIIRRNRLMTLPPTTLGDD